MLTAKDFYERDFQDVLRNPNRAAVMKPRFEQTETERQDLMRGLTFAATAHNGQFCHDIAVAVMFSTRYF